MAFTLEDRNRSWPKCSWYSTALILHRAGVSKPEFLRARERFVQIYFVSASPPHGRT